LGSGESGLYLPGGVHPARASGRTGLGEEGLSVFEIIMLVCFGAAWPFSIYKSWRTKEIAGKSVVFLFVVFLGYVSGAIHKFFYHFDYVVVLYILNGLMVLTDMILYYRNRLYRIRASAVSPAVPEESAE
jgi:hypothetical protein